jgi:putative nucleotidyltransferase with HDIG domain
MTSLSCPSAGSNEAALKEVVARITEISSLPDIAVRVMEVASDEQSSVMDMKAVIETDPALSARVLRCVNSAAFGLRDKVSNLQQSISLLGMRQVRGLALTVSVAELFSNSETIDRYRRRDLWRHLVAVAITARMIAMRQRLHDFDDIFLAGLLHDLGIVLEDQYAHDGFVTVLKSLDEQHSLTDVERTHLGFDHAMLGAGVAANWGFSGKVTDAMGYHHASEDYSGDHPHVVQCVEVANLICTVKGYTSVGRKLVAVPQKALQELSLSRDHIVALAGDVDDEFAKNAVLFEL